MEDIIEGINALDAGLAYAFAGHLMDKRRNEAHVHDHQHEEPREAINDASIGRDFTADWNSFIGQESLKDQLWVHITSANQRGVALEHVLLASGKPGVGKTTMARLIAKEMGTKLIMLVPPFNRDALHRAAKSLGDRDILFIDEIHKLADYGKREAENLLHILEERRLYLPDGMVELADFTVIGATTDADKLPETILDRFPIKPHYEDYDLIDLTQITTLFALNNDAEDISPKLAVAIGKACRKTPRIAKELVLAVRDLRYAKGKYPTPDELLAFKDLDPDGMGPIHREYITGVYKYFPRQVGDETWYVAGKMSMRTMLRETEDGLHRIERELIEAGLIDRTAQGRRLTQAGINRARKWIAAGKGK